MKRYALLALLSLLPMDAMAYTCRYSAAAPGGLAGKKMPSTSTQRIPIPVDSTQVQKKMNIIDLARFVECKNDLPQSYTDIMNITRAEGSLSKSFEMGANIKGEEMPLPITSEKNVLYLPRGGSGAYSPMPMRIYYTLQNTPGELKIIKAGDTIATVQAHKYSIPREGESNFTWILVAANDAMITSGECDINNGESLEIDFGYISAKTIGQSERSVTRYIPYKCESPTNMGIKMSLVADKASFSEDLIRTSNSNLAVKTEVGSGVQQLKPFNSVHSVLVNGIGGDNYKFTLIKNPQAKSVNTGAFSASGTLIMSAD